MNFKEVTLKSYSSPLSDTEATICKHVIESIRDALKVWFICYQVATGQVENASFSGAQEIAISNFPEYTKTGLSDLPKTLFCCTCLAYGIRKFSTNCST